MGGGEQGGRDLIEVSALGGVVQGTVTGVVAHQERRGLQQGGRDQV
jgi:hypothetical protein